MWKIGLVVLLVSVAVEDTAADCNVCNPNGVACINKTAFHLCDSNIPLVGQTFVCPLANQVCTKLGPICATGNTVKADCGDDTLCGNCEDAMDGSYACTSQNNFTMCFNHKPSTLSGTCAQGQVCLVSRGAQGTMPCANECLKDAADMCNIDMATTEAPPRTTIVIKTTITPPTVTTPTTTIPTTPGPTNPNTVCQRQNIVGRFPYPNDTTCTRYINCYLSGGVLVGRAMTCPSGRYFNYTTTNCQITRPSNC